MKNKGNIDKNLPVLDAPTTSTERSKLASWHGKDPEKLATHAKFERKTFLRQFFSLDNTVADISAKQTTMTESKNWRCPRRCPQKWSFFSKIHESFNKTRATKVKAAAFYITTVLSG